MRIKRSYTKPVYVIVLGYKFRPWQRSWWTARKKRMFYAGDNQFGSMVACDRLENTKMLYTSRDAAQSTLGDVRRRLFRCYNAHLKRVRVSYRAPTVC